MDFGSGARVGGFEILGPLGAGGMGEVYRALDTRLGREVALKVLPAALNQDAARRARFDREARLLAALNHPGIAAIYGVEETAAGPLLILELVPGETLAPAPLAGSDSDRFAAASRPDGRDALITSSRASALSALCGLRSGLCGPSGLGLAALGRGCGSLRLGPDRALG